MELRGELSQGDLLQPPRWEVPVSCERDKWGWCGKHSSRESEDPDQTSAMVFMAGVGDLLCFHFVYCFFRVAFLVQPKNKQAFNRDGTQ